MRLACFFIFFPLVSGAQQSSLPANNQQSSVNYTATGNYQRSTLSIGSTVPDIYLPNIINHSATSANLSSFSNDLLILDFWASWCGACFSGLKHLQELQQQFPSGVSFLLVNSPLSGDDSTKLAAFFTKWKSKGLNFNFPSVYNDTLLTSWFPYKAVPHYVWLNRERKVLAITGSADLTAANITAALQGKPLNLPVKWERSDFNPSLPLATYADSMVASYNAFCTSYITGLRKNDRMLTLLPNGKKFTYINYTAANLLAEATTITQNRWRVQVADTASFYHPANSNRWSLELTVPAQALERQQEIMLAAINAYLPYTASIEQQPVKVYLLSYKGNSSLQSKGGAARFLKSDAGLTLQNGSVEKLVTVLNTLSPSAPVIVNNTGLTAPIDLRLDAPLNTPLDWQKALERAGFVFTPAIRTLPVLVISDKPKTPFNPNTQTK